MSAEATAVSAAAQRASSLRADFAWTLAGNAIYAGGQWAALMLLAKLTSPELVGQYAFGMAIAFPILMLTNLQLRAVVTSDVREQARFGDYLSSRLLATMIGLAMILVAAQFLGIHGPLLWVVALMGVAQAIEAVSDIYYARLQLRDRMDAIAKSLIARTALAMLGLAGGVYFTGNLWGGIAGMVLARAAVLFGYDIRRRTHNMVWESGEFAGNNELKPRWDPAVQRQLLRLSLPLGIISALVALHFSIPRYFIERSLGDRELGIFSAIAFLFAAGSMAVVSLGQAAFTRLARSYAEGNFTEFRALTGKLLIWGAALGVCGILAAHFAGREIVTLLFRPEYAEQAHLLVWIMAGGCIAYMAQFLGYAMTAARFYNSQVALFLLTNICLAVACSVLIPRQGLFGAVMAMLITVFVQLAGSFFILMLGMRRRPDVCASSVSVRGTAAAGEVL